MKRAKKYVRQAAKIEGELEGMSVLMTDRKTAMKMPLIKVNE